MPERNRVEVACHRDAWMHSPPFRCLGFDWSVSSNDPTLVECITYLYEACIGGRAGEQRQAFVLRGHARPHDSCVSLFHDERVVLDHVSPTVAIERLVWEVNRGVVEQTENQLLLHAAAAEADGRIALLAGPEGSGKSTLVTALVRAGLRYVTDETVAAEVPGGAIRPYPKLTIYARPPLLTARLRCLSAR